MVGDAASSLADAASNLGVAGRLMGFLPGYVGNDGLNESSHPVDVWVESGE